VDLPDKSIPQVREKKAPVIPKGSAKAIPRPAGRRFMDYVFAESPKTILVGVITHTFVPRIKAAGEEAFNGFLHGMLWGGGSAPSGMITRGTVIRGNGVVVNGAMDYNALSNPQVQAAVASGSTTGPYQDLTLASRELAERLLASLIDDLNQYRVVTVADLREAASLTPGDMDGNFGWYGLDGARIVQEREGYKLMLPKPQRV
jgi:hypothetical protein